ncbi:MAG: response regulator [Planctomycetota bacterium]|jgi:CheY-like chemotaxis protein
MSPAGESKLHQVLVVEDLDHEYVAITTAIGAVMPSCTFVEAKNVGEAERILEKEESRFDLIVLDLKLGEGLEGGLALLRPERVWYRRQIPVIVYTAVSNVELPQAAHEVGVMVYIRKLGAASTWELQIAVTRILEGVARIAAPSALLENGVGLTGKQFEGGVEKVRKAPQERFKKLWTDKGVGALAGTWDIARVLVRCAGALEVMLMLADEGPLTGGQLVAEAIEEENLLETIAELRKCDLLEVRRTEVFLTEKGRKVVTKLRGWRKERGGSNA